jgi:hypothetical protein
MKFPSRTSHDGVRLRRRLTVFVGVLTLGLCGIVAAPRAESPYETDRSQEWVWFGTGLTLSVGGWIAAHKSIRSRRNRSGAVHG